LPEGVALYLEAGQQLNLNLHLYNTGDTDLSGTSGIEVQEVPQSEVTHEAEIFLPGPFELNIPAGQETTISGTCTIQQSQTIFALFPHMHKLGTHFKTEVIKGGNTTAIWDAPYAFDDQPFQLLPEQIQLAQGDKIKTTCTWVNTTNMDVQFGDDSDKEMCFSILMRYPRVGGGVGGTPACPF
jgi:hypothetical protein